MNQVKPERQDSVPWIGLELELCGERPRQWAARFKQASPNQCNQLLITLARHASPSQIQRLFEILDQKSWHHRPTLQQWRETFTRLSPHLFDERTGFRTVISQREGHWLLRYTRVTPSPGRTRRDPRPAIIGFTGKAGLLMAPTACILSALARTEYDLILVRRRFKQDYFSDHGTLLGSIRKHLQSELKHELERSIPLGASNGGLAALCTAHALGLPLGIAIGAGASAESFLPNSPVISASRRPRWNMPWRRQKTRLLLAASADYPADQANAVLISDHFNQRHRRSAQATALLFAMCSRHNLPEALSLMGVSLDQFLLPLIDQELTMLPANQQHAQSALTPVRTAMAAQSERSPDLQG